MPENTHLQMKSLIIPSNIMTLQLCYRKLRITSNCIFNEKVNNFQFPFIYGIPFIDFIHNCLFLTKTRKRDIHYYTKLFVLISILWLLLAFIYIYKAKFYIFKQISDLSCYFSVLFYRNNVEVSNIYNKRTKQCIID